MPLDFTRVAAQIEDMAARLQASEDERTARLRFALEVLGSSSADLEALKAKIERSRTTWLVAGLGDGPVGRHPAPPCPSPHTVVACDGSHIDVDRHAPPRCYLINIGGVVLRYGEGADASLFSEPALYASDEDLVIADPVGSGEQPVEGALLGVKRAVEECRALGELGRGLPAGEPALALLDGSLILWGLGGQAYPEYVREELLRKGFLLALDEAAKIGGRLALASYISFPRSTDVVNALRVAICPHDLPDCDRCCPRSQASARGCEAVAGLRDRDLFERLLEPGERSASFISRSTVVRDYYREQEVRFFYLRLEEEVARLEYPRWVEERGLLDLAHALVLEQCRLGRGYPVALAEAHEQAVVTGADREQFRHLVELALGDRRISLLSSAKSQSKRTRWV